MMPEEAKYADVALSRLPFDFVPAPEQSVAWISMAIKVPTRVWNSTARAQAPTSLASAGRREPLIRLYPILFGWTYAPSRAISRFR